MSLQLQATHGTIKGEDLFKEAVLAMTDPNLENWLLLIQTAIRCLLRRSISNHCIAQFSVAIQVPYFIIVIKTEIVTIFQCIEMTERGPKHRQNVVEVTV